MSSRKRFIFSFACSILFHLFLLSSREVRGVLFPRGVEVPETRELVMELTPAPEPPQFKATKQEKPKIKRFVDVPEPNQAQPERETDLIGTKNSAARTPSPAEKETDSMPALDGDSEMLAVKEIPPSVGEVVAPSAGVAGEPAQQEESAAEPQPSPPQKVTAQETAPPEQPSVERSGEAAGEEPAGERMEPEPTHAEQVQRESELTSPKKPSPASRIAVGFEAPPATVIPEAKTRHPEAGTTEKGKPSFNIKMDEYAEYYKHIRDRIALMWEIQHSGDYLLRPIRAQETRVVIDFVISPDGSISDVTIADDGGDLLLATAFRDTIASTDLNPFPPYIVEKKLRIRYTLHFR